MISTHKDTINCHCGVDVIMLLLALGMLGYTLAGIGYAGVYVGRHLLHHLKQMWQYYI